MGKRLWIALFAVLALILVACSWFSLNYLTRWPEKQQICIKMGISLDNELCRGRGMAKLLAGGFTPGVTTRAEVNTALAGYRTEVRPREAGGVAEVYEFRPVIATERFYISYDENDLLISVTYVD
jgi:hypothetical protein